MVVVKICFSSVMTKTFFLSSPSEKGKVLGIENNKLRYILPGEGETMWKAHSAAKGFHVTTASGDRALHYDPSQDEEVKVVDIGTPLLTEWHVNEQGEIYTKLPNGNRKYLWSMSDGVYVTADEYLAENWKMVSLEGFDMTLDVADKHSKGLPLWVWILIVVLGLAILWVLTKK
jgi:hypothetical protein